VNRTPRLHGTKRTVTKVLLAVGGSCWSRQSCSLRLLHDRSAHQITSSRNTSSTDRRTRAPRQLARVVLRLLVVVVAIATPTARLEVHADGAALTRVPIMYLGIWLVWTSFMLYANVAGDSTHRRAMLLAMGCIAVIAAAVPAADDFRRGQVFAVAYVVARVIASRTWQTTARVWSTGPPPSSPSDRCPGSSRSGSEPRCATTSGRRPDPGRPVRHRPGQQPAGRAAARPAGLRPGLAATPAQNAQRRRPAPADFGSHIPGWMPAGALALVVGAQVLFRKADAYVNRPTDVDRAVTAPRTRQRRSSGDCRCCRKQ